jgi:hypothetical protein
MGNLVMSDKQMKISEFAKEAAERCIFITGSARSGTSILGSIVGSMRNVEYLYEPPFLLMLLIQITNLKKKDWKLLFETYIYEEFLLNALAGRAINTNIHDFSAINKTKIKEEIDIRLSRSFGKKECELLGRNSIVAFKIPDIVETSRRFLSYYPSARVVIVVRDGIETINSIIEKKWFNTQNSNSNLIWPYVVHKKNKIPYFVKKCDYEKWIKWHELDKSAYYYIQVNKAQDKISRAITIKYSNLIANPGNSISLLAQSLGLEFGELTETLIKKVEYTGAKKDLFIDKKISKELRDEFMYYSERSK